MKQRVECAVYWKVKYLLMHGLNSDGIKLMKEEKMIFYE